MSNSMNKLFETEKPKALVKRAYQSDDEVAENLWTSSTARKWSLLSKGSN